jgi:hypothetical protein
MAGFGCSLWWNDRQQDRRSRCRTRSAGHVQPTHSTSAFLHSKRYKRNAETDCAIAQRNGQRGYNGCLLAQSSTEAYFGRLRSALDFSTRAHEKAHKSKFDEMAAQVRVVDALWEAEFGNLGQARNDAARALTLSSGRNVKLYSALAFARAGNANRSEAFANSHDQRYERDSTLAEQRGYVGNDDRAYGADAKAYGVYARHDGARHGRPSFTSARREEAPVMLCFEIPVACYGRRE